MSYCNVHVLLGQMLPSLVSLVIDTKAEQLAEYLSAWGWEEKCFDCTTEGDENDENSANSSNSTDDVNDTADHMECIKTQAEVRQLIESAGFTINDTVCGQQGQVSILKGTEVESAVKVMVVDTIEKHNYRLTIWKAAEVAGVGPKINNYPNMNSPSVFGIEGIDDAFYSFVYMELMQLYEIQLVETSKLENTVAEAGMVFTDPINDTVWSECDMRAIDDLIDKTAHAGILHTDSHTQNIMKKEWLFFVDWEAGVLFAESKGDAVDHVIVAKRLMWSRVWNANQKGHLGEQIRKKTQECGEKWTTVIRNNDGVAIRARVTLVAAAAILRASLKSPFIDALDIQVFTATMIAIDHDLTMFEATQLVSR